MSCPEGVDLLGVKCSEQWTETADQGVEVQRWLGPASGNGVPG